MQLAANVVIAERFRLNRQLGRGGMGSVWHATHLGLDIPCAVKFIEGEYAALPEAQARFEREAKAAAQLRSPHVVQILDHGVFQGTPYIAMELLDGEDLGKRLARVGRLAPQEICSIVTQVCRALTKAHGAGIVHRDLKPDNIFLVKDDDREIAKVLDFGIAKAASGGIDGSNTKTGAMLGTPYYMSPEQAQGIKAVDHRSDLWSLGVIVFQALTGRLPFESEALGDLLVRIIVAPVPVPTQVAPDLPVSFDRFWAKAAQRDPALRYQSAKELADGLSLVFGASQHTDVMDRAQIRAAMASDAGTPGGTLALAPGMVHTPPGYAGVGPHATPQPGMPQATPHPFHQAPQGGVQRTTGAPSARTFNGADGTVPKNRVGMMLAVAGVALVVLAAGAVGVTYAVKGKGAAVGAPPTTASASAAAMTTTTSTTATAATDATAAAVAATTSGAATAPTAFAEPSSAAPTGAGSPAATAAAGGAVKPPRGQPAGAAVPPPAKSTTAPPSSSSKKPKPVDLGI
jgi:serine/threonine-protein kinase